MAAVEAAAEAVTGPAPVGRSVEAMSLAGRRARVGIQEAAGLVVATMEVAAGAGMAALAMEGAGMAALAMVEAAVVVGKAVRMVAVRKAED